MLGKANKNQTFSSLLRHSSIPCFLPFPPPEIITEPADRPTSNPLATTPSPAATLTTTATYHPNMVFAIPSPRTAEAETDEQPVAATPFSTLTHNRHSIHTQPEQRSTTAAITTTTAFPYRGRPVPSTTAAAASFEGSGSGEPSGDDQTEEEEELDEDEAGSGIPKESSGADDPVGKSLLFHFITHDALTGVWEGFLRRGAGQFHSLLRAIIIIMSSSVNWKLEMHQCFHFYANCVLLDKCQRQAGWGLKSS